MSGKAITRRRAVVLALLIAGVACVAQAPGAQGFVSHKLVSGPNVTVPASGQGNPYPSAINVDGLDGVIESMTVTFFATHATPDDLDVLLVGPNGQKVVLMSDVGGTADLSNKQLRFKDGAAVMPDNALLDQVEYRPTNVGSTDTFPSPAPGGAAQSTLGAAFGGTNPNGQWRLFVVDDSAGTGGTVNSWRVTITTRVTIQGQGMTIPSSGAASRYPSLISISQLRGKIARMEVQLTGITHNNPDDLDVLLLGPSGERLRLMSDAGGNENLSSVNLRFLDSAASELPNGDQITSGSYKPTNRGLGDDNFPSPAPGTPYENSLSVFNGDRAEGNWRLFVADDDAGNGGSISSWSLTLVTVNNPPSIANIAAQTVDEGETRNVALTATDGEGDPLAFSESLPSFISLDDNGNGTATLHIEPEAGDFGTYNNLQVRVSDGEFSTSNTFNLTVTDGTPPTTTAVRSPAANAAGWNTGNVGVKLEATDVLPGSGVASITYNAAGAQPIGTTSVGGSNVQLPLFTAEGTTTINFFARDAAGNVEGFKSHIVRIDKTNPVIVEPTDVKLATGLPLGSGDALPVRLTWLGEDPNGAAASGLESYLLRRTVDGGPFIDQPLDGPLVTSQLTEAPPGGTVQFRINAFDVAGRQSQPSNTPVEGVQLVQDSDAAVVDAGTWQTESNPAASGGGRQFASQAGRKATLSFTGTDVAWVAERSPASGIAEVRVDGALEATVDLFSSSQGDRFVVFRATGLADAAHTIEIKVTGTKNAQSTGTRVAVDAFGVLNPQ